MVTETGYTRYQYRHEVVGLLFDSGGIEVKYIPEDTRFTVFQFILPILPTFDPNNMVEYVDQWAPHDKWFAQEQILQHGDTISGVK